MALVEHVSSPLESGNEGQIAPNGKAALVDVDIKGDAIDAPLKINPVVDSIAEIQKANPEYFVGEFGDAGTDKQIEGAFLDDLAKAGMLSLPLTLVILVVVFGSLVAAGIPLLLALTAIFAPPDRSRRRRRLLDVLSEREREERAAGRSEEAALEAAASTSGRSVLISGLTVIIAMAGMFFARRGTPRSLGRKCRRAARGQEMCDATKSAILVSDAPSIRSCSAVRLEGVSSGRIPKQMGAGGMDCIAVGGPTTGVARAPSAAVLCAVVVVGLVAAACTVLLALTSDHIPEPGVHAGLQVWGMLGFVLAGVVAWWRRPESRFGVLMVVAGAAWFLSTLSSANLSVPYTLGLVFDLVPAVAFLHVVLAFPSGRLERPVERALVVVGYATALGVHLVGMTLGGFGPDNLFEIASRSSASHRLENAQLVLISALCLTGVVLLVFRRREAGRPLRRSLALLVDSFALSLVMVAFLYLSAVFGLVSGETPLETIRRITFFVIGLAPAVFLVGLLHARLARSAVGDLIVELQADPTPADLRDSLARTLRDPSLTLVYWLPEFGTYAGLDGRPTDLATAESGRAMTLIDRDGVPVAALLHDPSLEDEPELLAAATAGAGIALENARLNVELRARLEERRGSRARMADVANKERQRLERNLHDGAQQRLVALSLELSLLGGELTGEKEAQERLTRARREIAASLAELREIARGIHPAVVSGHGLAVALEQLAALAPVPVRLTVATAGRLPEAVEVAAYYLVCESLANVGKYAHASSVTVDVNRQNGCVLIEVSDDGVGGADTERGSGLRGIADRVEALDGRLRIWSPAGGGTRIRAEIPCAP